MIPLDGMLKHCEAWPVQRWPKLTFEHRVRRVEKTPGRNDPCSCGSGKKYKKCCG